MSIKGTHQLLVSRPAAAAALLVGFAFVVATGVVASWSAHDAARLGHQMAQVRLLVADGVLEASKLAPLQEEIDASIERAGAAMRLTSGLVLLAIVLTGAGVFFLARRASELEQLITVCAWTRRVYWKDRWVSWEDYLLARFNIQCTHGICEEAARSMRIEMKKGEE